jgi:hypothetical protein
MLFHSRHHQRQRPDKEQDNSASAARDAGRWRKTVEEVKTEIRDTEKK